MGKANELNTHAQHPQVAIGSGYSMNKWDSSEAGKDDRAGETALDPKRLTRAMERACKILGIPQAGPHDLRRTGRTMMTGERVGVGYDNGGTGHRALGGVSGEPGL